MTTTFLLSQIFVGVSATIYAFSLIAKSKEKLLLLQTISSIFFVIQYLLLNAYIGAIVASLEEIRTITFYCIEKKNNTIKARLISSIIFILVGTISSIFTWESWYSIFPLAGLLAVSICLAFENVLSVKLSCLFSAVCATIYLFSFKSIFGACCQIFILLIGIGGLIYWAVKNKKEIKANAKELKQE